MSIFNDKTFYFYQWNISLAKSLSDKIWILLEKTLGGEMRFFVGIFLDEHDMKYFLSGNVFGDEILIFNDKIYCP